MIHPVIGDESWRAARDGWLQLRDAERMKVRISRPVHHSASSFSFLWHSYIIFRRIASIFFLPVRHYADQCDEVNSLILTDAASHLRSPALSRRSKWPSLPGRRCCQLALSVQPTKMPQSLRQRCSLFRSLLSRVTIPRSRMDISRARLPPARAL